MREMEKAKRLRYRAGAAMVCVLGAAILGYVMIGRTNELGLSRAYLYMGGNPDVESLKAATTAAADGFLSQCSTELAKICDGPANAAVDYSLGSRIAALGYRSSYYYHCFDIYLPYSMRSGSGKEFIIVFQLSDATQGNGHNPGKFRVIRAMVIDDQGQVVGSLKD